MKSVAEMQHIFRRTHQYQYSNIEKSKILSLNSALQLFHPYNRTLKETLIKSNYFQLAKSADIFHEDRRNRITITSHFVKNSDRFFCAEF